MKKLILTTIIGVVFLFQLHPLFAMQDSNIEYNHAKQIMKNNDYGSDSYSREIKTCYQQGNIFCTALVGDLYAKEKQYNQAMPLLKQFLQANIKYQPKYARLYDYVYYSLAQIYTVKHDIRNAIFYNKKSASFNDAIAAANVSGLYYAIANEQYIAGVDNNALKQTAINSYAWFKVAMTINNKTQDFERMQRFYNDRVINQYMYQLTQLLNAIAREDVTIRGERRYQEIMRSIKR